MTKEILRVELKEIRSKIKNRKEKNIRIFKNFCSMNLSFDKALVYISTSTEVDTLDIIAELLHQKKEVYAPVCVSERVLKFYKIESLSELSLGKYNILEPIKKTQLKNFDNTICLVPGLGFTIEGDRIGYGKAYYDNFLMNKAIVKIGLCFEEQMCKYIPTQENDIKIDYIITDKSVKEVKAFGGKQK